MMFLTHSFRLVDAIINHPEIRPTIEPGAYRLSSFDVLNDSRNVVYAGPQGAILFLYKRRGIYDGHIAMLRGGRGKAALQAGREVLDSLYQQFEPAAVRAAVPLRLRGARMLCRLLGFHSVWRGASEEFFIY